MLRETATTTKINGYFITASWGPRAETPEDLAVRFFRMIGALKPINPVFSQWIYERKTDLESHGEDFAKYIAKKIERDDFGALNPNSGYWFGVRSPDGLAPDRRFSIQCHVGKSIGNNFANGVVVGEDALVHPVAELHSYAIFRSALLAIVDAWDPETVEANCHWLVRRKTYNPNFHPAWMRYLCPALARQANPPASAVEEHFSNGGILLSATDQTFDVDNPRHVSAAEEIAAALAPLGQSLKSSSA